MSDKNGSLNLFSPKVFVNCFFDHKSKRPKGYNQQTGECEFIHRGDTALITLDNGVTKPMKLRTVYNPELKSYVLDFNPWLDFMENLEALTKGKTKNLSGEEWVKIFALIKDAMDYTKGAYRVRKKYLYKYYKSSHWEYVKKKYLKNLKATSDGRPMCIRKGCQKPANQVHHKSYDNLANEQPGDLEGLCRGHHLREHPEHLWPRKTQAQIKRRQKVVAEFNQTEDDFLSDGTSVGSKKEPRNRWIY